MSISKSIVEKLTDKFEKDVERFFVWATKKEYELKNSNDQSFEWSINLLNTINFKEPGRNKLESLIKSIRETYNIFRNGIEVDDAKLMSRDFKEYPIEKIPKPKKSTKKDEDIKPKKSTKKNEDIKPKKSTKKNEDIQNEDIQNEDIQNEIQDEDIQNEIQDRVKLDTTLDTTNTFWLDTLEYWTRDLIKVFGKPKKTGSDKDDHLYEWKIQVNNTIYTIYDWHNKEKLDDITWHLGTDEENEANFKVLIMYIDEIIGEQDIKLDFENLDEE